MKKQITIILGLALMIGMISLVSAIEMVYPGETYTEDLSTKMESYLNYTIKGNTSDLNISVDNLIATIIIPVDYIPGDFEITFYGYKDNNIVEKHYSSGGSSCSYNPNHDWKCGSWTSCINGTQIRICNARNNCGSIYGRPDVTNDCSEVIILDNNDTSIDELIIAEEKLSAWQRFINWLKRLFSRKDSELL